MVQHAQTIISEAIHVHVSLAILEQIVNMVGKAFTFSIFIFSFAAKLPLILK
jgi:hypothetical protein